MQVLVLNVGSSSVRHALFRRDADGALHALARGHVAGIDGAGVERTIAEVLGALPASPDAVAHRVAHGGDRLVAPAIVDDAVEREIAALIPLAPLHNPSNLAGIRTARARLPHAPHVAVFDTAFHARMPAHAFLYGLPRALHEERGVRRYGFHGPSHRHMAETAARHLGVDAAACELRVITCHLGAGASVAAIRGGVSIDTSMGMTPLEGLVMVTRCGDLDPGVVLRLAREGLTFDAIDDLLQRRAGVAGLAGMAPDFRAIEAAADAGDPCARLAIDVFVHRLRKYVGAYAAILGGVDVLAFAGGVGEGSAAVRAAACATLGFLGVEVDAARNGAARPAETGGVVDVSAPGARARVLVVHTDEERVIASEACGVLVR